MDRYGEVVRQSCATAEVISGTRVLIVEDEAILALHLQRRLSRMGYVIAGMAATGAEALRMIEEIYPDIVLMDIHLHGEMDGIETARRIPRYLHIPVVYLTAFSEDSILKRAADTYPYGYLIKPFLDRELHATIRMALERSRADEAVRENEAMLFRALCTTSISKC